MSNTPTLGDLFRQAFTPDGVRVIWKSLPARLAVIVSFLTFLATQAPTWDFLPDSVLVWIIGALGVATAAVAAVLRVVAWLQPADPGTFGVLPPTHPRA